MRRFVVLATVAILLMGTVQAQKYACVNTQYILQQMPEYTQAQAKLTKYIEEWRGEIEEKQQEVDELRQQYQQESYLLPDNLKQRRQDEIRTKEAALRALQQQRFAAGGDLDQKRAELTKPVQDRVYNAIERVAREKNYAFVFDRSASATVIYVADKYDISAQVLEVMGVKPSGTPDGSGAGQGSSSSAGKERGNPTPSKTNSTEKETNQVKR